MTRASRPTAPSRLVALVAGALLALLGASGLVLASSGTASAATPGYVRLAHLSPDTPEVDVYLTSFRGGSYSTVLPGVGYGALSDYERLTPGVYSVAMRPPGASSSSAPLIRTTVTVEEGKAYTVAGVGRNSDLALKVLTDDLSRPASGSARVRVVQASSAVPVVDVATTTGMSIAQAAKFPSTTAYAEVPAQQWTIKVTPRDSQAAAAEQTIDVKAGAIYTALILDKGADGLQLLVRTDAAGAASAPVGSVDTGLGGTAGVPAASPSSALPWPVGLAGVIVLGLVAATAVALTRTPVAARLRGAPARRG